MGADRYSVNIFAGYGILVPWEQVAEGYQQEKKVELEKVKESALLEDLQAWILTKTPLAVYDIDHRFAFVVEELVPQSRTPDLSIVGPYEIDEYPYQLLRLRNCPGKLDSTLITTAQELTGGKGKLGYAPGLWQVIRTGDEPKIRELGRTQFNDPGKRAECSALSWLPVTVTFSVGKEKTVIKSNKTLLSCRSKLFASFFEAFPNEDAFDWPTLSAVNVQKVVTSLSTRHKDWESRRVDRTCADVSAHIHSLVMNAKKTTKEETGDGEPPHKLPKVSFGNDFKTAMEDERYLDCTFLCGADQAPVRAARVVVAAMNPVLCKMLYGTGRIHVDASKPITLVDFEAATVKALLLNLIDDMTDDIENATEVNLDVYEQIEVLADFLGVERSKLNITCALFEAKTQDGHSIFRICDCPSWMDNVDVKKYED